MAWTDPHEQIMMVQDARRTRAFAEAIRRSVTPGSVVLDVGAGSGLLSLIAARAGARRVFAVERTHLTGLIQRTARDNGLEERIEVLHADALDLTREQFTEPPDLIVSETLSHVPSGESMHAILSHVRELFPDAACIPARYRLVARPARSERWARMGQLDDVEGVDLSSLERMARHQPDRFFLENRELQGVPGVSAWQDCNQALPEGYEMTCAAWDSFNALAVTWEAELGQGVRLETSTERGSTHWRPVLFPVLPPVQVSPPGTRGKEPPLPGGSEAPGEARRQSAAGARVHLSLQTQGKEHPRDWSWRVECGSHTRVGEAAQRVVAGTLGELLDQLGLDADFSSGG